MKLLMADDDPGIRDFKPTGQHLKTAGEIRLFSYPLDLRLIRAWPEDLKQGKIISSRVRAGR